MGFAYAHLQTAKNIIKRIQETGNTPIDRTNPNGIPKKGIEEKS
jgi:hypothetical protein